MNTPEWVFPWRGRKKQYFPMIFAHLLVGAGVVLMLGLVRVKVVTPKPMAPRKASLIYLTDDAQGRALALQAQEGGPFPSHFEPSQWEGMAALEAEAMAELHAPRKSYVPVLRDLPKETRIAPITLAGKGETVFPKHPPAAHTTSAAAKLKPAPTLYPLSGIPLEAIPTTLPPFSGTVDGEMTKASWRFLVRLNPNGGVVECVSLEKGGETDARELETWLHLIQFHSTSAKPSRWIAVGIGFSNQPADGTDAR
jgi:hypothetical protein